MKIQATGQIYPSSQSGHKQPCHTENNSVKEDIEMFHQEVPGRKDWHLSCKCASRRQPSLTASSEPAFTEESYFVWAHPLLKDSLHLVFKMVHRCSTLETRGRTLISNASPGNSDQIYHVCWVFTTVQLLWKILPPSSPFHRQWSLILLTHPHLISAMTSRELMLWERSNVINLRTHPLASFPEHMRNRLKVQWKG